MKKYLYFFFFLFFSISIVEIVGRYYIKYQNSINIGTDLDGKVYGIIRSHKELGHEHIGNAFNSNRVTNNVGFLNIDDLVMPKKRNLNDIIFIAYGGSTTYGYNVEQNETWTYVLQNEICNFINSNQKCRFSVFNGGHIMWSIGHIYKKIKKDLPLFKPNYIIIYTGINEHPNYEFLKNINKIDVDIAIKNKEYGLTTTYYNNWWIKYNSIIGRLIHYKLFVPGIRLIRAKGDNNDKKNILSLEKNFSIIFENYIKVLEKLINFSKEYNTKVIFVTQSQGLDKELDILKTLFSQKAKKKVKELGAIIIESGEFIEKYNGNKNELFSDSGIHYSAKGSKLFGKFLFNKLNEINIFN